MPNDNAHRDVLSWLTEYARQLDAIDTPDPNATVFYEIMSGALIWRDETRPDTPTEVIWALRSLFAYRTYLMTNDIEPDNEFWHKCVALFPNWIGFLPERRKPTPELLAEYRRGDVSLRWCIRNFDRNPEAEQE
jgi:hypothetical protein